MKYYTRNEIADITGKSKTAVAMCFFYFQIEPDKETLSSTKRPLYHYSESKAKKVIDKLKGVHYLNNPYLVNQKIASGILCDVKDNELNLIIPSRGNFIKVQNL